MGCVARRVKSEAVKSKPRKRNLEGEAQYRIIPSRFPPLALFENLVDTDDLEIAYALESLTNDRLQAEAGNLYLLDKDEWVTGQGASVVMAAFTHIGNPSRFSDGSYGVYYAGLDEATAIAETVFHAERRLAATSEDPIELEMRCYRGIIKGAFEDIRGKAYDALHQEALSGWPVAQQFAAQRRSEDAVGLLYRSVRNRPRQGKEGGLCIAAFKPSGVSRPRPTKHLRYCWNGERVNNVLAVSTVQLK